MPGNSSNGKETDLVSIFSSKLSITYNCVARNSFKSSRCQVLAGGSQIVCGHGVSTSECGVTVLLPRSLLQICSVTTPYIDGKGRLLVLDLTYDNFALKLFAVYAPTQSNSRQRAEFLQTLRDELHKCSPDECSIVMCGDFNVHLGELDIDKQNFCLSQFAGSFLGMVQDFDLCCAVLWRGTL